MWARRARPLPMRDPSVPLPLIEMSYILLHGTTDDIFLLYHTRKVS